MDTRDALDWLDDPAAFAAWLGDLDHLDGVDRQVLVEVMEQRLTSSSWVTAKLFKPGIRNLYMQERLGASGLLGKMQLFLGDQDYHFKFLFQDAARRGTIPTVLDLLRQAINTPRFRFRLEVIDILVELDTGRVIPLLFNLLSGSHPADGTAGALHARVDANLDALAALVDKEPAFNNAFHRLRLLLASHDPINAGALARRDDP